MRAFVLGDRIAESAVGLQNNPEIAMPVRLIRAEREALPDEVDGFIGSALLVRQQAGVVQERLDGVAPHRAPAA